MATKRSKKAKKIASSKKLPLNVKLSGNLNIPGLSNKAKKGSKINMPYFKGGKAGGGKGKGRNGGKSSQTVKVIIQTGQDGKSFAHANVPMPFAIPDPTHKQVLIQPQMQPTVQSTATGSFTRPAFRPPHVTNIGRKPPAIKTKITSSSSSSSSSDSDAGLTPADKIFQGFLHRKAPQNFSAPKALKTPTAKKSFYPVTRSSPRNHTSRMSTDSLGTGSSRFLDQSTYINPNNNRAYNPTNVGTPYADDLHTRIGDALLSPPPGKQTRSGARYNRHA